MTVTDRQAALLQQVLTEGAPRAQVDFRARQLLATTDGSEFVARATACMALASPAGDDAMMPADERLVLAKAAEQIAREAARAGHRTVAVPLLTRAYVLHGEILRDMGDFAGACARGHEAHAASTGVRGADGDELRLRIQLSRGRVELSAALARADGSLAKAAEYFQWAYDQMVGQDPADRLPEQDNLWAIVVCHHAFIQHLAGNPYVADAMIWTVREAALRVTHPMIRRAAEDLGPLLWGNRPDGQYTTDAEFSAFMLTHLYP